MKPILKFIACILLIGMVIVFSCKKDSTKPDHHFPPVANAGPDVTLKLSSCGAGSAVLDGSGSSDPDDNISSYLWRQVSGPYSATLSNSTSAKATAQSLFPGQYAFELKVTDAGGLSSKDTVAVNVIGIFNQYDLDVTSQGSFTFSDNYQDCYYGPPCWYYDLTSIQGLFSFSPIGQFHLSVYETADTAFGGSGHDTYINLYTDNVNGPRATGTCSVSFKQLIEKGGGAFAGTFKPQGGSAEACGSSIYDDLAPLTIAGNLDAASHTISMSIKGKIYF
jgi:hypothetical protein